MIDEKNVVSVIRSLVRKHRNGLEGLVFYHKHCQQRMEERQIQQSMVDRVLIGGTVVEGPLPGNGTIPTWRVTFQGTPAGTHLAVVADLVDMNGQKVVVVTTYNKRK